MNILTPQTREEWLKIRRGYISSTESAALFGMSPYETAFEVGVGKQKAADATDEELIGSARMKWGQRLQDAIAQGVADDYGVQIEPMGLTYAVLEEARMGASFDYQIVGSEMLSPQLSGGQLIDMFQRLGPGILEVKNVDSLEYKRKWIDSEAPDHIELQLQHQLHVLGLPWGAIAALVGGNRVGLIVRERDRKVGNIISSRVKRFWMDFEKGILPPAVMPEDAEAIISLYQYAEPNKVMELSPDSGAALLIEEYAKAAAQERELEDHRKSLKAKILEEIKDAERVILPGFTVTAAMRAPVQVKAHTRVGFRDFRVSPKKEPKSG